MTPWEQAPRRPQLHRLHHHLLLQHHHLLPGQLPWERPPQPSAAAHTSQTAHTRGPSSLAGLPAPAAAHYQECTQDSSEHCRRGLIIAACRCYVSCASVIQAQTNCQLLHQHPALAHAAMHMPPLATIASFITTPCCIVACPAS
jgi:hypothetical protein